MKARQRILKIIYPVWKLFTNITGRHQLLLTNKENKQPVDSIYNLKILLNTGTELSLQDLKGKKILFVNTASDCVYTTQYAGLQKLHEKEGLMIIAFPSNEFKEQEQGTDEEISSFCKVNYGVSFPIAKKTVVKKRPAQHPVFQWLTNKDKNGWNDKAPVWNFSKYLVDESGKLSHVFGPPVEPVNEEMLSAIR